MRYDLKIYLAGAMSVYKSFEEMNGWRIKLKNELLKIGEQSGYSKLCIINPVDYFNFQSVRYESQREVKQYDLKHVITSDIVIVNLSKLDESPGTMIELQKALDNDIPVFAIGNSNTYKSLHPWIKDCITHYFYTDNELLEYIRDMYFV